MRYNIPEERGDKNTFHIYGIHIKTLLALEKDRAIIIIKVLG